MKVFKIDEDIVFGKVSNFEFSPNSKYYNIFGEELGFDVYNNEFNTHLNTKNKLETISDKNNYQMEVGKVLINLFREHIIRQNEILKVTGNGLELLQNFQHILLALNCGMLEEAGFLISHIKPTDLFNQTTIDNFSLACISANIL